MDFAHAMARICLAAFFAAFAWAGSADAATYHARSDAYTSAAITNFPGPCANARCANYTMSMRTGGWFETAAPLAPGLSAADIQPLLTDFHFSDGLATFSMADPAVRILRFEASTDAAGTLTSVSMFLERWVEGTAPHVSGDRMDYLRWDYGGTLVLLFNAPCSSPNASDACVAHVLDRSVSWLIAGAVGGGLGTLPGAPVLTGVAPGDAQATIEFDEPVPTGGLALEYTATCGAASATGAASPIVVGGLANGVTVSCSVTAGNVFGSGPSSNTLDVTPFGVSDAPTIVSATPGNGQATVAFLPPVSDGGSPVTGYTATCGAQSVTGPASPLTVTGLANGTSHLCSVTATNAAGVSPPSATASVTPAFNVYSGPSATGSGPITASFTGGGAACSFSAPRFIAGPPGAAPVPPTHPAPNVVFPHGMFDFSTTGCVPGSTLTFTIVYPSAVDGATYWKYGPTAANPVAHWYTLPATFTGNTVTFSITDGGLGDDDLATNGTVVDQGGPGVATGAMPVPTLEAWTRAALALLLLGAAAGAMRRRR